MNAVTVSQGFFGEWVIAGGSLPAPLAWGHYMTEGEAMCQAAKLADDQGAELELIV